MTVDSPATLQSNEITNSSGRKVGSSKVNANAPVERPFSVRGFTSILLVLCLLLMLASGIALYVAPRGRVANWTAWTAVSLSRQQWMAVHINASILFVVGTVSHLAMNWSRFVGYVKKRSSSSVRMKRELASAVAIAVAVLAGTILELPPINIPVEVKYNIRELWEHPESRADRHQVATSSKFSSSDVSDRTSVEDRSFRDPMRLVIQ